MRRGQVALEFLTTYGWAMLIILVMIGTISYFGVMNPSKLLPSRCTAGSEFVCNDYQILSDGTVSARLSQSLGQTVLVQSFTCERAGTSVTTDYAGTPEEVWSPQDMKELTCDLPDIQVTGEKTKVNFEIVYKKSSAGFEHFVEGEVYAAVQ